jgi:hypothetical protein
MSFSDGGDLVSTGQRVENWRIAMTRRNNQTKVTANDEKFALAA